MNHIDEAIQSVRQIYQGITGSEVPRMTKPYAPIPAEKDPVLHVQEQLQRVFSTLGVKTTPEAAPTVPPLSIWESDKEILVSVELPGVSREQLAVSRQDQVLTLTASPAIRNPNGHQPRLIERPQGPFQRTVILPDRADAERLQARMENGILEIRVPIKDRPRSENPKKVEVQ